MPNSAKLELKTVNNLVGNFFVPRYQRGYRWERDDVEKLLDDLWEHCEKSRGNHEEMYNLQPLVVKKDNNRWELIDGQQRLTTVFLLLKYWQEEGLNDNEPQFTLAYETRPKSGEFLNNPDLNRKNENIDFYHMCEAWDCIKKWFEKLEKNERQTRANGLFKGFGRTIQVIWYEAGEEDAESLFTRLNVGKIPLTDAELVKAQLLTSLAKEGNNRVSEMAAYSKEVIRVSEMAAEWDRIERDLRRDDIWSFLTTTAPDSYPTRITLLLDAIADKKSGKKPAEITATHRVRYHTFETLRVFLDEPIDFWEDTMNVYGRLIGWFEDRHLYHKIGYLVATGFSLVELIRDSEGCTKKQFKNKLDTRITKSIAKNRQGEAGLREKELAELTYTEDAELCRRVLLLMNVETIRKQADSSERYPFWQHREDKGNIKRRWTLEHIHAQHSDGLDKKDRKIDWLTQHIETLQQMPSEKDGKRRDALVHLANKFLESSDQENFEDIHRRIIEYFTSQDSSDDAWLHSISNLALLPHGDNAKLKNYVFATKRRLIIEIDKSGAFIPICTRRVFLKYYTEENPEQMDYWAEKDREGYLDSMQKTLEPYLKKENSQ